MALATSSKVTGRPGKARSNSSWYRGSRRTLCAARVGSKFISRGWRSGNAACSSKVLARPSEKSRRCQPTLSRLGVLRGNSDSCRPQARLRPSMNSSSGLWQVPQLRRPLPESISSKKSISPSRTFSTDGGLSGGWGGAPLSGIRRSAPPAANAPAHKAQASNSVARTTIPT